MASIMQGTTPAVTIQIPNNAFRLSDVTAIELYVKQADAMKVYRKNDLIIDAEANTLTKSFSVEETSCFYPGVPVIIQGRFWIGDAVFGIDKIAIGVKDMQGVGANGWR